MSLRCMVCGNGIPVLEVEHHSVNCSVVEGKKRKLKGANKSHGDLPDETVDPAAPFGPPQPLLVDSPVRDPGLNESLYDTPFGPSYLPSSPPVAGVHPDRLVNGHAPSTPPMPAGKRAAPATPFGVPTVNMSSPASETHSPAAVPQLARAIMASPAESERSDSYDTATPSRARVPDGGRQAGAHASPSYDSPAGATSRVPLAESFGFTRASPGSTASPFSAAQVSSIASASMRSAMSPFTLPDCSPSPDHSTLAPRDASAGIAVASPGVPLTPTPARDISARTVSPGESSPAVMSPPPAARDRRGNHADESEEEEEECPDDVSDPHRSTTWTAAAERVVAPEALANDWEVAGRRSPVEDVADGAGKRSDAKRESARDGSEPAVDATDDGKTSHAEDGPAAWDGSALAGKSGLVNGTAHAVRHGGGSAVGTDSSWRFESSSEDDERPSASASAAPRAIAITTHVPPKRAAPGGAKGAVQGNAVSEAEMGSAATGTQVSGAQTSDAHVKDVSATLIEPSSFLENESVIGPGHSQDALRAAAGTGAPAAGRAANKESEEEDEPQLSAAAHALPSGINDLLSALPEGERSALSTSLIAAETRLLDGTPVGTPGTPLGESSSTTLDGASSSTAALTHDTFVTAHEEAPRNPAAKDEAPARVDGGAIPAAAGSGVAAHGGGDGNGAKGPPALDASLPLPVPALRSLLDMREPPSDSELSDVPEDGSTPQLAATLTKKQRARASASASSEGEEDAQGLKRRRAEQLAAKADVDDDKASSHHSIVAVLLAGGLSKDNPKDENTVKRFKEPDEEEFEDDGDNTGWQGHPVPPKKERGVWASYGFIKPGDTETAAALRANAALPGLARGSESSGELPDPVLVEFDGRGGAVLESSSPEHLSPRNGVAPSVPIAASAASLLDELVSGFQSAVAPTPAISAGAPAAPVVPKQTALLDLFDGPPVSVADRMVPLVAVFPATPPAQQGGTSESGPAFASPFATPTNSDWTTLLGAAVAPPAPPAPAPAPADPWSLLAAMGGSAGANAVTRAIGEVASASAAAAMSGGTAPAVSQEARAASVPAARPPVIVVATPTPDGTGSGSSVSESTPASSMAGTPQADNSTAEPIPGQPPLHSRSANSGLLRACLDPRSALPPTAPTPRSTGSGSGLLPSSTQLSTSFSSTPASEPTRKTDFGSEEDVSDLAAIMRPIEDDELGFTTPPKGPETSGSFGKRTPGSNLDAMGVVPFGESPLLGPRTVATGLGLTPAATGLSTVTRSDGRPPLWAASKQNTPAARPPLRTISSPAALRSAPGTPLNLSALRRSVDSDSTPEDTDLAAVGARLDALSASMRGVAASLAMVEEGLLEEDLDRAARASRRRSMSASSSFAASTTHTFPSVMPSAAGANASLAGGGVAARVLDLEAALAQYKHRADESDRALKKTNAQLLWVEATCRHLQRRLDELEASQRIAQAAQGGPAADAWLRRNIV